MPAWSSPRTSGGSASPAEIGLDSASNIYVIGETYSSNFPVTANAYQPLFGQPSMSFAAKIAPDAGGPPPPVMLPPAQQSGVVAWHPHYTVSMAAGLSASVDLADGHVDVATADMSLPARGADLAVSHTWDSEAAACAAPATTGGWNSSVTRRMTGAPGSVIAYTDATGALWQFAPSGAGYLTPPGLPWRLTAAPGSTPTYTLSNVQTGRALTFDPNGFFLGENDSYGNANRLDPPGAPTSYSASGGQALAFRCTTSCASSFAEVLSPYWQSSPQTMGVPNYGQHVLYTCGSASTPTCVDRGDLCSITWAAGTNQALPALFQYTRNLLTGITTPGGHQWAIAYTSGQVSITSPAEAATGAHQYTTTITYGAGTATVVEGALQDGAAGPNPLSTTYTLDGQGRATLITDGLGHHTAYTYDVDNGVHTIADGNGNTTTYTYGLHVGPDNGQGTGTGSVGLVTLVVGPAIRQNTIGGAVGTTTTTYTYDPNTFDLLEENQQEGGRTSYYTYDNRGGAHHQVATVAQLTNTGSACTGARTRAGAVATPTAVPGLVPFDAGGIRPAGCTLTLHWRGTINTYDPATGDLLSTVYGKGVDIPTTSSLATPPVVTADAALAATYTRSYTHDPASGDPRSASGNSAAGVVKTQYLTDGDGNPTTITSPNGNATIYSYDHWGRLAQETQPSVTLYTGASTAPVWKRAYSGDGELAQITDPLTHPIAYVYDPLGRKVKATDQNNDIATWTYSATTLTGTKDPVGRITAYVPDAAGRLVSRTGPAGDATHDPGQVRTGYQYDPAGNPAQVAVGPAAGTPIRVEASQYDAQNNRVRQDVSGVGLVATLTTLSAPHPDGMVGQVQAPNGDLTLYSYDRADERISTTFQPAGTPTTLTSEATSYDSWGNVTSHAGWAGQARELTLDAAGQPSLVTDYTALSGGVQTISTSSGYDPDGNLLNTSVTEQLVGPTGTSTPTTATYSYAATPNALDWTIRATDNGLATGYGYDALGRLRTLSLPLPAPFATGTGTATPTVTGTVLSTVAYGLDSAGMLRTMAEGTGPSPTATAAFFPNRDGQLTAELLPGAVRVASSALTIPGG